MDLMQYGVTSSEVEFLAKKERDGNLVWSISSEFTTNADQITITPVSGKTFYLVQAKLYPVVDSIITGSATASVTTSNRRTDIELTFDGIVKDVLTHDMETTYGSTVGGDHAQGNAAVTGQYNTLAKGISMTGNGVKTVKLTSTNTSGTYRVSILGYYEVS